MDLNSITFLEGFVTVIVTVMLYVGIEMIFNSNDKDYEYEDNREDEYWNGRIK